MSTLILAYTLNITSLSAPYKFGQMVSLYYVTIVSRQLAHRNPESPAVRSIVLIVGMGELDRLTGADIYLRCNFHMIKKYMTRNLDSLVSRYTIK
jgi:hypothetical protein